MNATRAQPARSLIVLALTTDPAMYRPAQTAFPVILGQSWRMMGAGIISYGVSVQLNVWIFSRLAAGNGPVLLNAVYDATHSYIPALWGAMPICLLSALLFLLLGPYPDLEMQAAQTESPT